MFTEVDPGRIVIGTTTRCVHLPGLNLQEDEIKLLLSVKLLEDGLVSLGKAAEIAGYSEKVDLEILLRRGVSPLRYGDIDLYKEVTNA